MPFPLEYKFIRATEDQLGFKFPEKYKAKMQIDNGGEINIDIFHSEHESDDDIEAWWLFPFQDTSDIKKIKRTMNHLSAEHQSIREIDGFPEYSVAIAHNGAGDYLLLQAEDSVNLAEEIYIWRHDEDETINYIAASIEDLM